MFATTYDQGGLCINIYQNEIYIGGDYNCVMQHSLNGIGRYDGSGFQPLGRGINNGIVRCMCRRYNGTVYMWVDNYLQLLIVI